jgi:hypothetical protein
MVNIETSSGVISRIALLLKLMQKQKTSETLVASPLSIGEVND